MWKETKVTNLLEEVVMGTQIKIMHGLSQEMIFEGTIYKFYQNTDNKALLENYIVGDIAVEDSTLVINVILGA